MLENYGYRHTLRISNTYYFSTETMFTRKRLNVTPYVQYMVFLVKSLFQANSSVQNTEKREDNYFREQKLHSILKWQSYELVVQVL